MVLSLIHFTTRLYSIFFDGFYKVNDNNYTLHFFGGFYTVNNNGYV
jgi:hypothetical protein